MSHRLEKNAVENINKQNKKSIGSSVASDIRNKEITGETMPSVSNPEEEEK